MQQFTAHVQCVAWAILGDGDVVPSFEHERLCDAIIASAGDTKIGRDRRVMRDGRGRHLRSVCAERDSERASERVQMREWSHGRASTPSEQCVVALSGFCKLQQDFDE